MECESGVTRSILDELHSSYIQGDQMKGESGVTRSIIDELHSLDIQGDQRKVNVALLEVSLMKLFLWISKEIKSKVAMVLIEV